MNFKKHSELEGAHAFLSPSKYHWIRYDPDKITNTYNKYLATQRGTELHDIAKRLIEMGIMLENTKKTLNMYVNDAIRFVMQPEQALKYSINCFGTTDAISYKKQRGKGGRFILRIHDLKTGENPGNMNQLEIYAALFFLEYRSEVDINNTDVELRIYQSDKIMVHNPDIDYIKELMEVIKLADMHVERLKEGIYE